MRFDYMKLLVTQLRNQNPLEPLDNNEMAAQLSQFAQLEQLQNLNTSFERVLAATQVSQAATLVGKQVSYYSPEDGAAIAGQVDRVEFRDGQVSLIVGNHAIGLGEVISVGIQVEASDKG
ncbi:hypothetical protein LCGC14_2681030 [marine sediment metagenome]|uniref:FlgD Tudor-like domain-containing protein n=1 Tax=marine sediment metagenome TaxID=412755 RepID=A0A0F8ZLB7_9ZZZZ